jgi:hypothetical protein
MAKQEETVRLATSRAYERQEVHRLAQVRRRDFPPAEELLFNSLLSCLRLLKCW